ncbi:efflux RND transporter permease subunit [Zobellella maritima]|uniref:efflux RND transporter permease subunit n=1 Tax=Zobellella maritima TaxID=2059725 RepID=UPI000E3026A6|nr:efflux RND transporter permease subunit [Zobellella maritima]
MIQRLLTNHVLANLTFLLVLVVGAIGYGQLPRQQDPTINFNWLAITTALPGAAAEDVERQVTNPLEEALRTIPDTMFVSSNSRENVSSLLIRFKDIDSRTYDKRVQSVRRELSNAEDELPELASSPFVLEITSANAFPTVTLAVVGTANDENLRRQAFAIRQDLERLNGVDRVDPIGLHRPELQVRFDPERLAGQGLSPVQLADAVALWFRDIAAGRVSVEEQAWLVRLIGREPDADALKQLPLVGLDRHLRLADLAEVRQARRDPRQLARVNGRPAVLMSVMKQGDANTLALVARVQDYLHSRNRLGVQTGVELILIDDQTIPTRNAIRVMQTNALIGLSLVLLVAWLFLGLRIALLTAIGIPFILAGTFLVLWVGGETLNVVVLLGVVIVLGMLVDDAVVVVESIYYRLNRGSAPLDACLGAIAEVGRPVLSAVLTTMAAFLPLMLLPGILGQFMKVIPMVVSLALAISLLEAFWMLPAHVLAARVRFHRHSRGARFRRRMARRLQRLYLRYLLKAMRHPWLTFGLIGSLFLAALLSLALGLIRMDFFASDPLRLFYITLEMPAHTRVQDTQAKVQQLERIVRAHLDHDEIRAIAGYGGQKFTDREPLFGDHYGQLLVGLRPKPPDGREVAEIIDSLRQPVASLPGPLNLTFLTLAGGPPVSRPISIKVRGNEVDEVTRAARALQQMLTEIEGVTDIGNDAGGGRMALTLTPDYEAIIQAGLDPLQVLRTLNLLVDGELVADLQHQGQKLEIRVQAKAARLTDIRQLLDFQLPGPAGATPLSQLVHAEHRQSQANIRHYNFRRAITVEASLAEGGPDTLTANRLIKERWDRQYQARFANIDLDFSGELDDIQQSLDAMGRLFLLGVGVMYLILGTQFNSYFQPLLILATVPMAFTGVVFGLLLSNNPLSLYTLYGVVALAGIAVNSAIVLISAANQRRQAGMGLLHATLFAARRRLIPILITSLTTIAGLFSLATGLAGHSLVWGPVATAIVWGLSVSTLLTLFAIPLLYRQFNQ